MDKRNVRFVATYKAGPVLECHYDDDSYQWRYIKMSKNETAIADSFQRGDIHPVDLNEAANALLDRYKDTDKAVDNLIGKTRPKLPTYQKAVAVSDKAIKLIEKISLDDLENNKEGVETKLRELLAAIQNKLDNTGSEHVQLP